VSDFIKVKGARVDLADLRAALETMLERDTYQIEITHGEDGRHTVNVYVTANGSEVSADALRDLVMGTVELRLDTIQFCDAGEMHQRLYGAGGWKPRWLVNE
jgi:hypothetical protein